MKFKAMKRSLLSRTAMWLTAASMMVVPFSTAALAAKQGVYIRDAVYFSLGQVAYSAGTDKGTLRFNLELNNGSAQSIDFNQYGVTITDGSGASYTTALSEQVTARAKPHQVQNFKFTAQLPLTAKLDQLKVKIFQWDYSKASYMKDVGSLSVAAAMSVTASAAKQVQLNMYDLDAALREDAIAAFDLGNSYRVLKDGTWHVYTDLFVQNLGSSGFKLPANLAYNLKDKNGLVYAAQMVNGTSTSTGTSNGTNNVANVDLLPKQKIKVTLQTPVSSSLDKESLVLQMFNSSSTTKELAGTLDLKQSWAVSKVGDKVAYPTSDQNLQGATLSTTWAVVNQQLDGLHVQANVTLTNNGSEIISVPALTGAFQSVRGSVTLNSVDNAVRSAYLSTKESTTFQFTAILPSGLNVDDLQLAVLENKAVQQSTTAQSSSNQQGSGDQSSSAQTASALPILITSLAGTSSGKELTPYANAKEYTLGSAMLLDANPLIDSKIEVSLMELHLHENEEFGYNTVIAKYKINNKGTSTLDLPEFQTDLTSSNGFTYAGVRQTNTAKQILPNTSNVISYSFQVPPSETSEQLAMTLYNNDRLGIGSFKVKLQKEAADGPISFYPFQVEVEDSYFTWNYSNSSFTYRLLLFLDVTRQEQVIVDTNFSKVYFELVDGLGRLLGSQTLPFLGLDKLVSGKQTVSFNGVKIDQVESGTSINMYELIETPNGNAKRLVKVFKN
ncbi:hypothetical protein [Paenibacillus eucommiae]|uniref:Uncharacterized protein n=1 Tax=Paenibacillus eucommiae TaxID=1355755 RepID=A0ABS4J6L7_9BACL|nr:hypothetical protein [Paenibacillus eucommiae]MBP1995497.1 hypothetical protein [Paenibacillus eucommiae]